MSLIGPDGITPVTSLPASVQPQVVSPFEVSSVFSRESGLSVVKMKQPGAERSFLMTPTEARILGLQLLLESEKALCQAATLRMMLEPSMGNMPIEQAIEALNAFTRGTREALRIAELEQAQAQQDKRERESNGIAGTIQDRKTQ